MMRHDVIIVGGGLASARAIEGYRDAGGRGTIMLVSADTELPYHRPPLSKGYLRGETERGEVLVHQREFYRERDVDVHLGTEVSHVDPDGRRLEFAHGAETGYGKLLLATGAAPRALGVPGESLPGVHTLRTLDDSTRISRSASSARRAVVVGAGFIGMEVAASFRQLGLHVTLVHRGPTVYEALGSTEVSGMLAELYAERGVEIVPDDAVVEFRGSGRLEGAVTAAGREIEADLAVVGIGVTPEVGLLAESGIDTDDGVVVDERFRTSAEDVLAMGDVARFYDPLFERHRRIEHWGNADYQGKEVGRLLAGEPGGYDTVSYFFTDVFDVSIDVLGDVSASDTLLFRGSPRAAELVGAYLDGNRLVGSILSGADEALEDDMTRLIRERARLADRERWADPEAPLEQVFETDSAPVR